VDGGSKKMLEVAAALQDNCVVMFCFNVPMIIFNEKNCKFSYEEDVCTNFDEELVISLTLDALTLTDILTVKGRHVYTLIDVRFDSTNHPSTVISDDGK